jgi:hypothetical protein
MTADRTETETLDSMADRICRVLGEAMGGRFNVLANLRKEADAGLSKRTIQVVDRWADPDFRLTIEEAKPEPPANDLEKASCLTAAVERFFDSFDHEVYSPGETLAIAMGKALAGAPDDAVAALFDELAKEF